jgi:hypothetical protein
LESDCKGEDSKEHSAISEGKNETVNKAESQLDYRHNASKPHFVSGRECEIEFFGLSEAVDRKNLTQQK